MQDLPNINSLELVDKIISLLHKKITAGLAELFLKENSG